MVKSQVSKQQIEWQSIHRETERDHRKTTDITQIGHGLSGDKGHHGRSIQDKSKQL